MKRLRIITADSMGLLNDADTYKKVFEYEGYVVDVVIIKYSNDITDEYIDAPIYDLNLHLEAINDNGYIGRAKLNLFMPNQELFVSEKTIDRMDVVLCKSKIALDFFKHMRRRYRYRYKLYYTRFTTNISKDIIPAQKNPNLFIHLAGKSQFKNTSSLIYCWVKNKGFLHINPRLELHITCYGGCFKKNRIYYNELCNSLGRLPFRFEQKGNVIRYMNMWINTEKLPFELYSKYISSACVAICPSYQEGYGHYINEARYFNTAILTIDAKPMNELVHNNKNGVLVDVGERIVKKRMKEMYDYEMFGVVPNMDDLTKKIEYCIKNTDKMIQYGRYSRRLYDRDTKYFKHKMHRIIRLMGNLGS